MRRPATAEEALTAAGELGAAANPSACAAIIEALIGAGHLDRAEQVIDAFPGDAGVKNALHWQLVTKAADDGDSRRAEEAATRFGLLRGPGDRLRLVTSFLNSEQIARDRRSAEPILREIFTLGEQLDQAGGAANAFQRNEQYLAQEAARLSFLYGHTDLGVELYRNASRKDQRPLFAAFNDDMQANERLPGCRTTTAEMSVSTTGSRSRMPASVLDRLWDGPGGGVQDRRRPRRRHGERAVHRVHPERGCPRGQSARRANVMPRLTSDGASEMYEATTEEGRITLELGAAGRARMTMTGGEGGDLPERVSVPEREIGSACVA